MFCMVKPLKNFIDLYINLVKNYCKCIEPKITNYYSFLQMFRIVKPVKAQNIEKESSQKLMDYYRL